MLLSCFDQETWICTIQYGIVLKGGAKASAPPPAVDPVALANAQTQSNEATAGFQANLNNANTFSPFGSSQWHLDPSTGQYTLNQNLSPELQNVYGPQTGLAAAIANAGYPTIGQAQQFGNFGRDLAGAGSGLANLAYSDISNLGPGGQGIQSSVDLQRSLPTDFANQIKNSQDAAYGAQTQYLDPQFSQARSDLRQQLADQGIGINNAAYDRATGNLGRQQQQAYQGAQDAAVQAGNQEQATLFGEGATAGNFANNAALAGGQFANQAQGQGFGQQLQAAQLPLAGATGLAGAGSTAFGSALAGLTGLNPNFGWATGIPTYGGQNTTVSPTNVVGAQQVASQAAQNRFTDANTLNNQLFNGLGSLGSTLGITGQGGALSGLGSSIFSPSAAAASGATFAGLNGGLDAATLSAAPTIAGSSVGLGALGAAPEAAAAWIICTELMKQGRLPKRHWLAGSSVFTNYPERGKRGYYIWAIPTVRHLRKYPDSLYSRFVGTIFRWRAENIASHKGVRGARKLLRGAAVTAVLYPACKIIGAFCRPIDWTTVYREDASHASP